MWPKPTIPYSCLSALAPPRRLTLTHAYNGRQALDAVKQNVEQKMSDAEFS